MQPDDEGFLYPITDPHTCNDCGLCRQACAVNPREGIVKETPWRADGSKPLSVFAAWHLDEKIRRDSSSGGAFTALAQNVLARGGVVVGAAYEGQFAVRHVLIESAEDLYRLRGSKFVQSGVPESLYRQIRNQLKQGRLVLFSGTPCQVGGLRFFLRQSYKNLLCCDLICVGVPSHNLFQKYIHWECGRVGKPLVTCEFRNKASGWKDHSMVLQFSGETVVRERFERNAYCRAFRLRIALRHACYDCNFKGISRVGDLTIGDFWGADETYPEYDRDDKGTSLILVNTEQGRAWLDDCQRSLFLGSADLEPAIAGNPMLIQSSRRPAERETFYLDLEKMPFKALVRKYHLHGPTKFSIMASRAKSILKRIIRGKLLIRRGTAELK